ncbi:MAG: ABC transporter ATP-binding protein [Chloroflexota bacterium]
MKTAHEEHYAIQIQDLRKVYQGQHKTPVSAVDQLTLSVAPEQVFGFLGPNGAGKTTTIKMLCGLIVPTAGQLYINGYDVRQAHRQAMRQIGAVLEGTRNVYWRLSAWENLMYFGRLKGCTGSDLKSRATQLLRDLELWERRNDTIRTFSRGMQQKVAIACALIANPPIVLLDEPTLGLDIQAAQTVKSWIKHLVQEEKKTVILTTHQLDIAEDLCHRVGIIRQGKLITNQPLSELLYLFRREQYQIRVRGKLETHCLTHFPTIAIHTDDEITTLSGLLADQHELHALLNTLHSYNTSLLSVSKEEPNLEEVFMHVLTNETTIQREEEIHATSGLSTW